MTEKNVYANLTISSDVYSTFKHICDEKGLKYGKTVENMMRKFNNNQGGPP